MRKKQNVFFIAALFLLAGAAVSVTAFARTPSFLARNLKGEYQLLDKLTDAAYMISFTQTTCAVCLEKLPCLKKMAGDYKVRGLRVALVFVKEFGKPVEDYARKHEVSDIAVTDLYGKIALAWGVIDKGFIQVPQVFILDRNKEIVYHGNGKEECSEEKVRPVLEKLLPAN